MVRQLVKLVLVGLVMGSSVAHAADPDLVAWWRFDDGTGTVAADSSGNGHDGTFAGDPEWVTGRLGGALDFDGMGGERVELGTLDIQAEALTITFWLKADNLDTPGNDPRMVSKANGGGNNDHWWMVSSSRIGGNKFLRLRLKTTDGQNTAELKAGSLEVDEWIHATALWDGTEMRIYKNGEEAGNMAKGGDAVATDPTVHAAIGNQPIGAENRPFDGILDDVRIYSKALTEAEIASVMEGQDAQFPLATGPEPADGASIGATWTKLAWTPGAFARSHNLYMGTNFDDVNDGAEGTLIATTSADFQVVGFPALPFPDGLEPGTTYYWRIDEVNPDHPESPWKGVVWSFDVSPLEAHHPVPPDTMKFVETDTELSWTRGWGSTLFAVYFGTDPNAVADATGADESPVPTFDPGPLQEDTTYYWRVDSFDGTEWRTGDVWSFTTAGPGGGLRAEYAHYGGGLPEPPESAVQNVVLTRTDPTIDFQWGNGSPAEGTVNEDNFAVRWTGELEVPLTGRYTFWPTTDDGVLLYVNGREIAKAWRTQGELEQSGQIDLVAGEFAFVEMLYFSATGNAMAELRWQHELIPKGIIPAAALSLPVRASTPRPPDRSVNVRQDPELGWAAGTEAAQHDVYFGEDRDAVANADTGTAAIYRVRQEETNFLPGELAWNTTYYWRIDEVNDVHPDSPWVGPVWSFTTADFLVVEDFESYDDEIEAGTTIYQTWIDGVDNGTGSYVGYETSTSRTFAETIIVHGGGQSMPLTYDNTDSPWHSLTYRDFEPVQDWTVNGVSELRLWLRGQAEGNDEADLYVIVEDSAGNSAKVTYSDPSITTTPTWTPWVIPLADLTGVDLTRIERLTISVGDPDASVPGGMGRIFVDDIRVTPPAP